MNAERIVIDNIGPIHHVEIPLPVGGGIVTVSGRNGCGKTKTLEAVEALITGEGTIEKRHGSTKSGEIRLGEARMTVSKITRRNGLDTLNVETLEGRFSVLDLVDPGRVSEDANDAIRIKALIALSGAKADVSQFYDLVGGKEAFEQIVKPTTLLLSDPVALAAAIKRDIEAAAKKEENSVEVAKANAKAARDLATGYDPTIETDSEELQSGLEEAIREAQRLETESAANVAHNQRIEAALKQLETVADKTGADSQAIEEELKKATSAVTLATANVQRLKRELETAENNLLIATSDRNGIAERKKQAAETESIVAQWRQTANLEVKPDGIHAAQIAKLAVEVAKKAIETGTLMRQKRDAKAKAEQADEQARYYGERANELRDAARGVEEKLSGMVAALGSPLRVEEGRLVTDIVQDGQKRTVSFGGPSGLSFGQKAKIAIEIAVAALAKAEKPAMLVIPQGMFGELDPTAIAELDKIAKSMNCHILTAKATDDDQISAAPVK